MPSDLNGSTIEANGWAVSVEQFQRLLLAWGKTHVRSFPWRSPPDPYCLLVAEIMLHRTQVTQVVPIYEAFVHRFPTLSDAVEGKTEDVRGEMASLGLHWRIDRFVEMLGELDRRFGQTVPEARNALLSLSGVSDYVASAVRCFAFGHPDALVDTNTVRIVGRVFGLDVKPSSRRNKVFRGLLTALVAHDQPERYNYALLDLGHLVCLSRRPPLCQSCPLLSVCSTGQRIAE